MVYASRMGRAPQSILRFSFMAAALSTIPYLAINLGQIVIHDGSFIHLSKLEALMLTAVLGCAIWVGAAVVLAVCAWLTRGQRLLFGAAATAVFAAWATAVEPRFWSSFFDILNGGLAEWIFWTGAIATLLSLVFGEREGSTAHVR